MADPKLSNIFKLLNLMPCTKVKNLSLESKFNSKVDFHDNCVCFQTKGFVSFMLKPRVYNAITHITATYIFVKVVHLLSDFLLLVQPEHLLQIFFRQWCFIILITRGVRTVTQKHFLKEKQTLISLFTF